MSPIVMTGKDKRPGLACFGVDVFGSSRAHAAAQNVGADDEISVGVERSARSDHDVPPPRFTGQRVGIGGVLVAGQRVAHQNRVGFLGVQRAIGLVGHAKTGEFRATVQAQCTFAAQFDKLASV